MQAVMLLKKYEKVRTTKLREETILISKNIFTAEPFEYSPTPTLPQSSNNS
jgi:hypothetical protein